MALISMTGFAREEGGWDGATWAWEVKTVNGRGLDVRCRLPAGYDALEPRARALAGKYIKRGSCQLILQVRTEAGVSDVRINERALDQVLAAIETVSGRIEAAPPAPEQILALRGVLETVEPDSAADSAESEARAAAMLGDLEAALVSLADARGGEGAQLEAAISGQLDEIERLGEEARGCPDRAPEAIKARLGEQIARLKEAAGGFDDDRLHQEAVLIATKADIQEELDRLFAHVVAGRALLEADEAVGRKLDFLTQELNREANTICSKANSAALTRIGLDLKAVVDQMREQVQNIE